MACIRGARSRVCVREWGVFAGLMEMYSMASLKTDFGVESELSMSETDCESSALFVSFVSDYSLLNISLVIKGNGSRVSAADKALRPSTIIVESMREAF